MSKTDCTISRQYALIGERQVHYRYAGSGPLLVLIHQSPNNSKELIPLIKYLAPYFTVIAPDTPGYGQSDPLGSTNHQASIDDFVDALASFLDVLDLQKPLLYGSHTGAIIGVRLAARYPQKIAALVANGVLINSADERKDLCDKYFPTYDIKWDGTHLSCLWSRLRDQHSFFPWYERATTSINYWPATDAEIDANFLNYMEAGNNYPVAYRAAVDYAIADDLIRLTVPSLMLAAKADTLSRYVEHYPPLPANVDIQTVPDFCDIPEALLIYAQKNCVPLHESFEGISKSKQYGLSNRFVTTEKGVFHLLSNQDSATDTHSKPLLVLHELGLNNETLRTLMMTLSEQKVLIAPDLPGHGESDYANCSSPTEMAAALAQLLATLNISKIDVFAIANASACALALKTQFPELIGAVTFCNPECANMQPKNADRLPDLRVDSAGSHLLRGWYYLRDRYLYYPWYERSLDSQIQNAQIPEAHSLQVELLALLKSREGLQECLQHGSMFSADDYNNCPDSQVAFTSTAPCRNLFVDSIPLANEMYRWPQLLLAN
ncbi:MULTISPECIES: alpha/beta fold hydrolase [Aliiglaciecola]|uniref:alpha/beta fold hydrolase n=1 Tax=Aliiglaciecola TaxID=1406885 RepID=UPI001C0A6704|nr:MULTISPECIES: alpha/beta hydrolase [Aliiglaciecola]MBU2879003.1 alpha/beta fold hydrolase [Aliiglaciecola lipolytica]MDO6710701.1 alpha/beta fold hydrolase [Aliiglaciecola sp. 2_MG-2023]MDO6751891.1 alpha/beta fold hydrolase [Aliiglaciecola sp. 1_MG-2023]